MKEKRLLIVVDMQNDFVTGVLGTEEAKQIVPKIKKKIEEWDGDVFFTMDTHKENYLDTAEGRHLPIKHCIEFTSGWEIVESLLTAAEKREEEDEIKQQVNGDSFLFLTLSKETFGSTELVNLLRQKFISGRLVDKYSSFELVGVCTDICVISNALLLKAAFPEKPIYIDTACCAGTNIENHNAAIQVMKSCQIISK